MAPLSIASAFPHVLRDSRLESAGSGLCHRIAYIPRTLAAQLPHDWLAGPLYPAPFPTAHHDARGNHWFAFRTFDVVTVHSWAREVDVDHALVAMVDSA